MLRKLVGRLNGGTHTGGFGIQSVGLVAAAQLRDAEAGPAACFFLGSPKPVRLNPRKAS